jgi:hypothetical protein
MLRAGKKKKEVERTPDDFPIGAVSTIKNL